MARLEDLNLSTLHNPRKTERIFSRTLRGLHLALKPNGRREWHLRFTRPNGTRSTVKLGDYPDLSLDGALDAARAAKNDLARGIDPVLSKRIDFDRQRRAAVMAGAAVPAPHRFATVAADYILHAEQTLRPSTMKKVRTAVNVHLVPFHGWDIRRWDANEYTETLLGIPSRSAAASAHATARGILSYALEQGLIPANPLAGRRALVRKLKVPPRTVTLDNATLRAVMKDGAPLFKFQLLTGIRIGEATALEWRHVDLRNRVARLPTSKSGEPIEIVLSDAARRLLLEQRKADPKATSVFGVTTDKAMRNRDYRSHDARRTVSTELQAMGVSEEVRRAILHHATSRGIGRHYDHDKLLQAQLTALEQWATRLEQIAAGADPARGISVPADDPLAAEFEALS